MPATQELPTIESQLAAFADPLKKLYWEWLENPSESTVTRALSGNNPEPSEGRVTQIGGLAANLALKIPKISEWKKTFGDSRAKDAIQLVSRAQGQATQLRLLDLLFSTEQSNSRINSGMSKLLLDPDSGDDQWSTLLTELGKKSTPLLSDDEMDRLGSQDQRPLRNQLVARWLGIDESRDPGKGDMNAAIEQICYPKNLE